MTNLTINQRYASVKETYNQALQDQEETNRNLSKLNAKVEQAFYDIDTNNLKEISPTKVAQYSQKIKEELVALTARKANFDTIREAVSEARDFSSREPLNATTLETITALNPELTKTIKKLFKEAEKFNEELTKNDKHLEQLARQYQGLIKVLNWNIQKLNNKLEDRGLVGWIAQKVLGSSSQEPVPFPVNINELSPSKETVEIEEEVSEAETEAVEDSDVEGESVEEAFDEASEAEKPAPSAPDISLIDNNKEKEAPVKKATRSSSKKETTPSAPELSLFEEKPSSEETTLTRRVTRSSLKAGANLIEQEAPKKKAPKVVQEAPAEPVAPKKAVASKKRKSSTAEVEVTSKRATRSSTKKADQVTEEVVAPKAKAPAKAKKINKELAGLGITKEELIEVLKNSAPKRETRSSKKV